MEWEGPDFFGVAVERFEVVEEEIFLGWSEEEESFLDHLLKHWRRLLARWRRLRKGFAGFQELLNAHRALEYGAEGPLHYD